MTTWISVKDRLPVESDNYRVIRYDPISGQYKTTIYFSLAYKRWGVISDDITHWLEEPPMPEVTE